MRESCRLSPHRHRSRRFCETADADYGFGGEFIASRCEAIVVLPEGESLNSLFQELADWEAQLKALEEDIPKCFEEPSP